MIRMIVTIWLTYWAGAAQAETLRMAVTTSFHNSGLAEVLLPEIAKDTGIKVQLLVVGTGQALRLGKAGDVDAILVHSKAAEDAFVADGYALYRTEIMYNDFVIVGPAADLANLAKALNAAEALQKVALSKELFVSRGDDSGTHKKELALWQETGLLPASMGARYRSVGAGMGAALNTAAAMNAYILTDRASWLNFGNKAGMVILFSGDPALFNQYAYLPINPEQHKHVAYEAAQSVEDWLTSDRAKALIDGYQLSGQALFKFNARPK